MKYQSSNTKLIYNIEFTGSSKRFTCPECSVNRRKKNAKDLEFYKNNNRAYCFHCNTTFFEYQPKEKKQYQIPEWKNITELTDKAVKWFTGRMIKQETLNEMKIYSTKEYMPQFKKEVEVICFPFFFNTKLINLKYRGPEKSFKFNPGSELIFYNLDCLDNFNEIIVCEGEIDCLTFIENGYKNSMSVPNGANNNLEYLDNYIELFENKIIILSLDNDRKGIDLKDELIRRFGIENCRLIDFKECKDANEYFCKYGGIEFKNRVNENREIPIKGIVTIESIYNDIKDLFYNGLEKGKKIDFITDNFITWLTGLLCIVTGRPSSGKSEFVDFLVSRLNLLHGWKAGYYTPENYPLKIHYSKLHEKFCGKSLKNSNEIELDNTLEYCKDNFFYILDEENQSIDNILSCAKNLIKTKGIKILVIDPYNSIEHNIDKSFTETRYINDFLGKLIKFTRFNNILTFLIAHPTKLQGNEIPTLYSISGSAHFYNKTDYGFTVDREKGEAGIMNGNVNIYWQKIRFRHLGEQGESNLIWNYNNGRYEPITDSGINSWDNSNWLIKDDIYEPDEEFKKIEGPAPF